MATSLWRWVTAVAAGAVVALMEGVLAMAALPWTLAAAMLTATGAVAPPSIRPPPSRARWSRMGRRQGRRWIKWRRWWRHCGSSRRKPELAGGRLPSARRNGRSRVWQLRPLPAEAAVVTRRALTPPPPPLPTTPVQRKRRPSTVRPPTPRPSPLLMPPPPPPATLAPAPAPAALSTPARPRFDAGDRRMTAAEAALMAHARGVVAPAQWGLSQDHEQAGSWPEPCFEGIPTHVD